MKKSSLINSLLFLSLLTLTISSQASPQDDPVYIGFDAEQGHMTSTSDDAIKTGILIAIDEINRKGGVLGGRQLKLIIKDNRSVPARGIKNIKEFAEIKDLVAVIGGKFSPVMIAELDIIHQTQMVLIDVWGAADIITDNRREPNYCFRVSLKDSWAIETMIESARSRGIKKIGALLPVTAWGRSNEKAIMAYLKTHPDITLKKLEWYTWGEKSFLEKYEAIRQSAAQALILVTNEMEGSVVVKEVARLSPTNRMPIISHWGITGGNFTKLTGESIDKVDLTVVQTYSFYDQSRPEKLKQFYQTAGRLFNINGPENIPSPVGVAHAYDAVHILALAINKTGTTNRPEIREALENIEQYDGLIKHYSPPFTEQNHTALLPENLFMGRFRLKDDAILRIQ